MKVPGIAFECKRRVVNFRPFEVGTQAMIRIIACGQVACEWPVKPDIIYITRDIAFQCTDDTGAC